MAIESLPKISLAPAEEIIEQIEKYIGRQQFINHTKLHEKLANKELSKDEISRAVYEAIKSYTEFLRLPKSWLEAHGEALIRALIKPKN